MKIKASKYAAKLFTTDFYEADIYGGRGGGGSHNMSLLCICKMITLPYFRGFLLRYYQGQVRGSLWQDFKDRLEELSELNNYDYFKDFHIVDNEMKAIHLPTGNILSSKGFKSASGGKSANLKSLAGATHVYIEECEEVGQEEYSKLADSLRTIKGEIQIVRSWNVPSQEHWLIKDYFNLIKTDHEGWYGLEGKGIKGHLPIFRTYKDNIKNLNSNTIARFLRYLETNPKYYYSQILGLCGDGSDKKVYYNWRNIPLEVFNQIDGVESYGVDFGDTAPTTLVHVKYKDGCFYRKELMYKPLRALNQEYSDKLEEVRNNIESYPEDEQNNIWSKHRGLLSYYFDLVGVDKDISMYCDPAQKGLIIELRQAGYNAVGAKKDKAANINFINRAVNYYTDDSLNLEREYQNYFLETDLNKNPIDGKPKKGEDHILDGSEYACRGLKDEYGIIL